MKTDPKTQNAVVAAPQQQAGASFKALLSKPPLPATPRPMKAVVPGAVGVATRAKVPVGTGSSVATSAATTQQRVRSAAQVVTHEAVTEARAHHEREAGHLDAVRSDGQSQGQQLTATRAETSQLTRQQVRDRAVELITNELVSAFSSVRSRAANDSGKGSKQAGVPAPVIDATSSSGKASAGAMPSAEPGVDVEAKAAQAVALIEKIELFVKNNQRPALALTLNNSLGARVEIERIGPGEVALKLVGQRGPPSPEAVSRIRDEMQARGLKVAALSVA